MKKFNELGIHNDIMRAIDEIGHSIPTLVQEKAIPALQKGDDIIILSQTGSGKTLAFAVPALESINIELKVPQVLIICPTRELATQVNEEFKKLSKYMHGVKSFAVFGGQPVYKQIEGLKKKPNIIVGTPGRILDHIKRRTLKLETVNMLILDEADEMLKMGFKEDIDEIVKKLAGKRQGILASATMSQEIKNLTTKFLNNPITIDAGNANSPAKSVHQEYITVSPKGKKTLLTKMLNSLDGTVLIFCNTKKMTTALYDFLKEENFDVKEIHGDMKQSERTRAMNAFKMGHAKILVATDVAARGIDVSNITYVINYDYPEMEEYYIHRIGRTGRAHNKGTAYTFITTAKQMIGLTNLSNRLGFTIIKSELSSERNVEVTKAPSKSSQNRASNYSKNKSSSNKDKRRSSYSKEGNYEKNETGYSSKKAKGKYSTKKETDFSNKKETGYKGKKENNYFGKKENNHYFKPKNNSYNKRVNNKKRVDK